MIEAMPFWVVVLWAVCSAATIVILLLSHTLSKGRLFSDWQLAAAMIAAIVFGPFVLASILISRILYRWKRKTP